MFVLHISVLGHKGSRACKVFGNYKHYLLLFQTLPSPFPFLFYFFFVLNWLRGLWFSPSIWYMIHACKIYRFDYRFICSLRREFLYKSIYQPSAGEVSFINLFPKALKSHLFFFFSFCFSVFPAELGLPILLYHEILTCQCVMDPPLFGFEDLFLILWVVALWCWWAYRYSLLTDKVH